MRLQLLRQRMQPKTRQVHVGNSRGGMKGRQNITQFAGVFGI